MSNDTARNVLEAVASNPLSASQIAEKLSIPLSTVQYNLDKLNDAGLVKVERTKYSEKRKPVKIYAPQRKFVVIVPEKTDRKNVIATLKRYLTVIFPQSVAGILTVVVVLYTDAMLEPRSVVPDIAARRKNTSSDILFATKAAMIGLT